MIGNDWLSRLPVQIRKGIPVFVEKAPDEVRTDHYERYWEVVVRQLLLHYGEEAGRENGFAPANDFVLNTLEEQRPERILEIGGGVGRLAGELALRFSKSSIYMVDYSYNMLKSARDLWQLGREVDLDGRHLGWPLTTLQGRQLPNIWLGQAKGESLPFRDNTMDAVVSTFFIDRAADLEKAVREQWRVLRPSGRLVIVSPLNFRQRQQWEKFGETEKMINFFRGFGLQLLKFESEVICREPLDARGNVIHWRAAAWALEKRPPFSID